MSRLPLPAFAAGVALAVAFVGGPRLYDDAYITLRYARSIVEGQGFVFNPGEHVLGTTTPLLTLALAGLNYLSTIDLPKLAFVVAVGGHVATAFLLAAIGRGCGFAATGALVAVVYSVSPLVVGPVLGGMETSLFTAATLAALWPSKDRRVLQAVCAAAAALLRPEGLLVAALSFGKQLRSGGKAARQSALAIAAGVLPWMVFATWYFGDPIPQSLKAKWLTATTHQATWSVAEMFLYIALRLPFGADVPPGGF
ncbi:MAG TPA: hypothetical protein VMT89_06100, partial [Candidatus Acidoferrales bacterium]|nr:hypothetical protein [Candidatus Acidoferrales bacterium]